MELYPVIHCLLGKRQPGRSIETHTSIRPHPRLPFRFPSEGSPAIPRGGRRALVPGAGDASLPPMNDHSMHPVPASRRSFARWPLAIVLLVALHAVAVGCGGSSQPSGESAPATGTAEPPATESPSTSATESAATEAGLGAKVYASRCALCHGAAGDGDGPAAAGLNPKPRAHSDKAYMSTLTDEQILAVIRNGKGTMPAWGKVLSDAELTAVSAHVRTLAK